MSCPLSLLPDSRSPCKLGSGAGCNGSFRESRAEWSVAAGTIRKRLHRARRHEVPSEPGAVYRGSNELRVALENNGQDLLLRYLAGDESPPARSDFDAGARYMAAARELTRESLLLEAREDFFRGRTLLFDKNFPDATSLLESAVRLDPDTAYGYNALGIAYLEQARFSEAIPAFRDEYAVHRTGHILCITRRSPSLKWATSIGDSRVSGSNQTDSGIQLSSLQPWPRLSAFQPAARCGGILPDSPEAVSELTRALQRTWDVAGLEREAPAGGIVLQAGAGKETEFPRCTPQPCVASGR